MSKPKYIDTPEKMKELFDPIDITIELPFKKDDDGNYILFASNDARIANITKSNAKKYPNGYVYFIKIVDQDIYKIGVSNKPSRRLRDINSYLPYDFTILSLHFFKDVYDVEAEITKGLRKLKKEWFTLTIAEAKEIMITLHNKEING